jgi:predicted anti-sigma-YlaC factor YlaD
MLSCKEVSLLISQSYDARLTWRQRMAVRMHLLVCEACRRFARQMQFLRRAARAFADRPREAAAGLSRDAHERIRNAMREQD